MWNKMKLAAQIRIAKGERYREKMALPNRMSLVANPKSGPDYSVFIMK
jgi:hypothetical protein